MISEIKTAGTGAYSEPVLPKDGETFTLGDEFQPEKSTPTQTL
jgi:hypothetical protein